MLLYLVRHAIAGNRDPETWPDDSERPLTKAGVRRFRRAARGLRWLVPSVDLVLSSPYVRAWDTARILHEEARWAPPGRFDELIDSPPEMVLGALKALTVPNSVALVGHEPYLSRLAAAVLAPGCDLSIEFKKGAVACLSLESFEQLSGAQLRWLLSPRVLRGLE